MSGAEHESQQALDGLGSFLHVEHSPHHALDLFLGGVSIPGRRLLDHGGRILADLESRIRLEVTARQIELASAQAGKVVAQRGIEAARDAVRVARDRYLEGVLSSSELLDAETRLLRSELEATQTDAQIQVARANLNRAVGQ